MADWLELHALASPHASYPVQALLGALDLARESDESDEADLGLQDDEMLEKLSQEMQRREQTLGKYWPFRFSEDGARLEFASPSSTENLEAIGCAIYIFCLWLSQATREGLIGTQAIPITPHDRNHLFPLVATLAAAGFIHGPALSFGHPRPSKDGFLQALCSAYKQIGEGKPKKDWAAGISTATKDGEVDVIAWRPSADGLHGRLYLLGQVASGADWRDKSIKTAIPAFHGDFFDEAPESPCIPAMFIPFCPYEYMPPVNPRLSPEENFLGYFRRLTRDFGIVIYRYRLVRHAVDGLVLHQQGIQVDGVDKTNQLIQRSSDIINALRRCFAPL